MLPTGTHCYARPKHSPATSCSRRVCNASRVLKPGGSFYIWGGYANIGNYPAPLAAAGFYFSQGIVWDKQHPVLTRAERIPGPELKETAPTEAGAAVEGDT